jgi:two-component system sensor histidine kinase KdpD
MRGRVFGSSVGVLLAVALGAAMLPLRSHLSIATAALVLVIPVVAGVAAGGFPAGLISVAAGFLVYDLAFIPPYWTLAVGNGEHWVALGVYVVVMVVVARVVSNLNLARDASRTRESNARHLLDLSELLLVEKSTAALGETIVAAVRDALQLSGVALLLLVEGRLEVTASAGTPFSQEELARLRPEARVPVPLSTATSQDVVQTVALASSGRPVGLLVLRDVPSNRAVRETLSILANHLAIALERSELRERILHAELLEQVDRLRQSLIGAVSHDLRTPLATIKVASSTLVERGGSLSASDLAELHGLIDMQVDRLTRLVNSLLDMTRIQSGALEVRRAPWSVADLLADALAQLESALGAREIDVSIPPSLPLVNVDPLLIVQVLVNLLDNANRHGPQATPVSVEAAPGGEGRVAISVSDHGPGVPAAEREAIFETFVRFDTGGRSGLGLAIAKAFVEAHGDRIWVEEAAGGGARFVFTVPAVRQHRARD